MTIFSPIDPTTVRARFDGPGGSPDGIDLRPASAYEAITRQMVETLDEDLHEIKSRLDNLLFMVIGAIVIDIALRMFAL